MRHISRWLYGTIVDSEKRGRKRTTLSRKVQKHCAAIQAKIYLKSIVIAEWKEKRAQEKGEETRQEQLAKWRARS